jgi:hypothetical protein
VCMYCAVYTAVLVCLGADMLFHVLQTAVAAVSIFCKSATHKQGGRPFSSIAAETLPKVLYTCTYTFNVNVRTKGWRRVPPTHSSGIKFQMMSQ